MKLYIFDRGWKGSIILFAENTEQAKAFIKNNRPQLLSTTYGDTDHKQLFAEYLKEKPIFPGIVYQTFEG